jgi:hypothetical protein
VASHTQGGSDARSRLLSGPARPEAPPGLKYCDKSAYRPWLEDLEASSVGPLSTEQTEEPTTSETSTKPRPSAPSTGINASSAA